MYLSRVWQTKLKFAVLNIWQTKKYTTPSDLSRNGEARQIARNSVTYPATEKMVWKKKPLQKLKRILLSAIVEATSLARPLSFATYVTQCFVELSEGLLT